MPFVVFEGLDGAGKSTLISKLQTGLSQYSVEPEYVQDPGSTPLGEDLRKMILTPGEKSPGPKAELLMYQAARSEMVRLKILPALERNQWVFSDRFYSSTLAFQVAARGLEKEIVDALNAFVAEGCLPNLFVFIDIPIEERNKRLNKRFQEKGEALDRMELEAEEFHKKVRQGYLAQAEEAPDKWLILDGTQTPDQLVEMTLNEFKTPRPFIFWSIGDW